MSALTVSALVFVCVYAAALIGMLLRSLLPEHHLSSETKDSVKLAMGFVATMAALILGLLVASAKDSYDRESSGVTQMAAKAIYLDRLLANFGPEAKDVRAVFRRAVERVTARMWPDTKLDQAQLDPSASRAEEMFAAIQSLPAKSDLQTSLKSQAMSTCLELGQMRWMEFEEAGTPISMPMMVWIGVLFVSFGMFAPTNTTVLAALMLAALSVAGAILLILELRTPFHGLMQISNAPFVNALAHLGQ